jgi:hypothetical protein
LGNHESITPAIRDKNRAHLAQTNLRRNLEIFFGAALENGSCRVDIRKHCTDGEEQYE